MLNKALLVCDGTEIYPNYLDKEQRKILKGKYSNTAEYMWCGCNQDKKLYYRISEDLKVYPAHHGYEHDRYCSRYISEDEERMVGYLVNDDGAVTAYLAFNPKTLNLKDETDKSEESPQVEDEDNVEVEEVIIEKDKPTTKSKGKKEPKLKLGSLVRCINIDTYTERILNGTKIASRDTFSKLVYHRMKMVRPARMNKSIGELTLEKDGVRFIYLPFAGAIVKKEKGLKKCYFSTVGAEGKTYNHFIFPEAMERAIKDFANTYGIEPNEDTMMAGFQYYKKSRAGFNYKVLGRIHLFQVSNIGIYSRSLVEIDTFNLLNNVVASDSNIKFWIPEDDESVGAIIQVKGKTKKLLLLFRTQQNERITYNNTMYEPIVIGEEEPLTKTRFYEIVEQLN